jgi:hypothetical protein
MTGYLKTTLFAMTTTAIISGGLSPMAWAQDRIVNVVEQQRWAENANLGIRSGSFIFSPGISLSETYDDNVYRKNVNQKSDFITEISPSFAAVSDFDLHRLFFATNAKFGYYADNTSENYKDYSVGGGGRIDLDYETFLQLQSSYRRAHERRDSPDAPNADEPVEYSLTTHKASFTRALGIIKFYLDGAFNRFSFEDSSRGALQIDNSGRDRDIYSLDMRVAYEYFPDYTVYIAANHDWRRYRHNGLVSRDSNGYSVRVGTDLYITGMVKADIYVGYIDRSYESNLKDVDAVNYGGSIIWNPTGLTSLTAEVTRGVEETTFNDVSGDVQTSFSVGVDHLLRHNLFLSAKAGVSYSDYESRTVPRDDTNYSAGIGLEYRPIDGLSLNADYRYSERDSSLQSADYDSNTIRFSVSKNF